MEAFIPQPRRIPILLRLGIWVAERMTGKIMLPARILAWYPKAAIGSGVLEALVAHHDGGMDVRMLKIIRMAASYAVACPFCIDMNGHDHRAAGLSDEEAAALRHPESAGESTSFSERERMAIAYAVAISSTPLKFHPVLVEKVTTVFDEREVVILSSTAAQVNYWARLIQALGIPPAGFGENR